MAPAKRSKAIYHVIVPYRPPGSRSPTFRPSPTSTPVNHDSKNDSDPR
jgi:hypothetical protein